MNKAKLFITLLIIASLSACIKETSIDWEQLKLDEISAREKYLSENNITISPTESGLYYIETIAGAGETPSEGVKVEVVYDGRLLDGTTVFGRDTIAYRYESTNFIAGFEEAVGYMKKAGKATAIVPSELAFGPNGNGSVPKYSTIIFDIELVEVYGSLKEVDDRNQYLIDNEIITDSTSSGLYYIETLIGEGASPAKDNLVTVKYAGKFLDGKIFDSGTISYKHGAAQVISGWEEAIEYMKVGGKASLIIPSKLGYGSIGNPTIPGYTTILFDVELISVSTK